MTDETLGLHRAATLAFVAATLLAMGVSGSDLVWEELNRTDFPSALCNDFTRAGYFIRRGVNTDKWIIFLESGGLCYSADTCNRRYFHPSVRREYERPGGSFGPYSNFDPREAWAGTLRRLTEEEQMRGGQNVVNPLMTSMQCLKNRTSYFPRGFQLEGRDILDINCAVNPVFCQYNQVVIPYCSSDAWLGEETQDIRNFTSLNSPQTGECGCFNYSCFRYDPSYRGMQFTFRGKTIFQNVFQDLLNRFVLKEVVLVGSSAGGLGVINNAKWVRDILLPVGGQMNVIFDSAWFVNFQGAIYEEFDNSLSLEDSNMARIMSSGEVLLDIIERNVACKDTHLGYPCCISAHCLLGSSEYYPQDVPTLAITSLYDVYLLAPALAGLEPVNSGRSAVGYALDFLRTIGEYGGAVSSTLEESKYFGNISFYVSECLQHIYLSTSSLWGEDGASVFGDSSVELANELVYFSHTIRSGVWNSRYLATYQAPNSTAPIRVTISDALNIWYEQSLRVIVFRDDCRGPYCNSQCPETFELGDLTSNNWPSWLKILIATVIVGIAVVTMVTKLFFALWLWWIQRKQALYLESLDSTFEATDNRLQFPDCFEEDAMSVACIDLHYTVQYRATEEVKDERKDCTAPLVLQIASEPEENEDCEAENTPYTVPKLTRKKSLFPEDTLHVLAQILTPKTPHTLSEHAIHLDTPYIPTPPPLPPIFPPLPLSDGSEPVGIFGQRRKKILKGISVYFNPGELVGIMGPSGCGKTTFLDLLTGRRKKGAIKGEIYVNGIPVDETRDWYIANTGYVLQLATPYYEELTVRENLTLAAQMRLPKSFSLREKFERVEQVMEVTGLLTLGDTVVGGATGSGLSGGQKRRLSVAIQLLKLPSVIFLDEPTSGLDAAASFELLSHLNKLADSNRAVVLTIHQPRLEIFHMFDRLMLLSDGKVAYHGVPDRAYEVFVGALKTRYLEHGLIIPELENHNPADLIMDMLGNQRTRKLITEFYQNSQEPALVKRAIQSARVNHQQRRKEAKENRWQNRSQSVISSESRLSSNLSVGRKVNDLHASTFNRLATLEARAAKRSRWVNTLYLPVIFFAYGFLLGTVYFQQDQPLLVVSGFCVYSVASALFMFPFLYIYYQRALEVCGYERADGVGKSFDIVIQGFIRGISAAFLPVFLCAGVLYLLLINTDSYNFKVFAQVALVNISLNQTWTALLICLICVFPEKAFRLSPIISSVAGFTSGFFIPIPDIPWWYRWLSYINPNYYGFSSSAFLLLNDFKTDCDGTAFECYTSSGEYVLTQFDFHQVNPYLHILILLLFTVFYLALASFSNWCRNTTIRSKFRRLNTALFKRSDSQILDAMSVTEDEEEAERKESTESTSPAVYPIEETEEQPLKEKGAEGDHELESSQKPLPPHTNVRAKWQVAAQRSLEQNLEPEFEPVVSGHVGRHSSPQRPSQLDLSEEGGVRRRRRVKKSVFLHEGDSHLVWKGKPKPQGPLLANIALVALRKKREKDLQERRRNLNIRVAATQAVLKDQTEELLDEEEEEGEDKEEEEEKEEEKEEGVNERKGEGRNGKWKRDRMTFRQATLMVQDDNKRKRTARKHSTSLTDKVNFRLKASDDRPTPEPFVQSKSLPGSRRSSMVFPAQTPGLGASLGAMSISQYKAIVRKQRQSHGQLAHEGVSQSAYFHSIPASSDEIATHGRLPHQRKQQKKRPPNLHALKEMAARRAQIHRQREGEPQATLSSCSEDDDGELWSSLTGPQSPVGLKQPDSPGIDSKTVSSLVYFAQQPSRDKDSKAASKLRRSGVSAISHDTSAASFLSKPTTTQNGQEGHTHDDLRSSDNSPVSVKSTSPRPFSPSRLLKKISLPNLTGSRAFAPFRRNSISDNSAPTSPPATAGTESAATIYTNPLFQQNLSAEDERDGPNASLTSENGQHSNPGFQSVTQELESATKDGITPVVMDTSTAKERRLCFSGTSRTSVQSQNGHELMRINDVSPDVAEITLL